MSPVRKARHLGRNIIGYFPSLKMRRMINFESLLERDFIYLLDYEQAVEQFCEQPLTLNYKHQGKRRQYTPDFHVIYGGRDFLFECKPRQFVADLENQVKFDVARDWCDEQGWTFGVITDTHLAGNCRLRNVKLLTRFARYPVEAAVKGRILSFLARMTGPISLAQLAQFLFPERPQAALIPLLHMAFHHQLSLPLNEEEITWQSTVTWVKSCSEKGLWPL